MQSSLYNAKINFARNKDDTDKTFPKWGGSRWQLFCHFCGSSERWNKHVEKLCWENTRTIKKSPNTGLGHTYRITPYHENPVGPTFYGIIVCSPLQLMFCCSITTPYIAYIEDNPQNTTLKIISRHVWVWISSHTLNPLYHFEAVIRIHKSSSRPSLLDMIPQLGSMPRLQLSHPDSWHNWNTCLNRPLQHAFRIHSSNLFKITPKRGIVIIDHSRNTIAYHNALCLSPKVLHKHCLQFLLAVKMAPRETENNAYAKFWGEKKEHYGMLWYFLEWSI